MTHVNRVVIGNDGSGKSAVVLRDSPNHIAGTLLAIDALGR